MANCILISPRCSQHLIKIQTANTKNAKIRQKLKRHKWDGALQRVLVTIYAKHNLTHCCWQLSECSAGLISCNYIENGRMTKKFHAKTSPNILKVEEMVMAHQVQFHMEVTPS